MFSQVVTENLTMFLVLFALCMVLPWALSDNVSTKPGLKIFRDEYKSVTAACLDLGFAKKACKSGSYSGILSHLESDFLHLQAWYLVLVACSAIKRFLIIEFGRGVGAGVFQNITQF